MTSKTPEPREAKSSASPKEVIASTKDEKWVEEHHGDAFEAAKDLGARLDSAKVSPEAVATDKGLEKEENKAAEHAPPLPEESLPPLPAEAPPAATEEDDGWAPVWDQSAQAFYFYNRFTGATQWTNPRVPEAAEASIKPTSAPSPKEPATTRPAGGYDPSIHGDYDPTAWYAQPAEVEAQPGPSTDPAAQYTATGQFNRFTGRWQAADLNPENFNDENKSKRQMNAFFDVDAAANSHDGRSLKAERSGKKLSKTELKQFKEKRKAKKEEKRRAWLRD
ncbi:hypothetical protein BP5796_11643 [Coleophoma crateriformis]|uniref:WW domain-containing protein n=1 Tax=Coleophoma crateriformis TaxID=565419 RepID=A0A3D8QE82_9HELO|nr:hypothetical protein BP5796_11643 [Coleophoma crateriformis]